jgi:hypothetical protein
MPDNRSEDLRREAARCFESAERPTDPHSRSELIPLGNMVLEFAASARADH